MESRSDFGSYIDIAKYRIETAEEELIALIKIYIEERKKAES